MSAALGWFLVLALTGVIVLVGWWQWKAYVTLDQRIDQLDSTLLDSAGTRVEKVLDAPPGSVVVPYVATSMVPVQTPAPVAAPVNGSEAAVRSIEGPIY